jgi:EAL domain-containing protein (putative c-di-GMP-specific phosphodiesterase class I)
VQAVGGEDPHQEGTGVRTLTDLAGTVEHLGGPVATADGHAVLLSRILERDEVHSVFQPIVDLDSECVVGYEALARGPVGALERPDDLFAAARHQGRLADLDELCRRVAVRGAMATGIHAPLTLFVNVEPGTVDVSSLAELQEIAEATSGPQLVLELTERSLAARPAQLLETVRRLRAAGWRIALDDVGADDLSLTLMPVLHPEIVKLDLSLVQRRPSPEIAEIMNAVNAYSERTGAVILAEGIEDQRQLAVARALGARLGQGWLLGRPGVRQDLRRAIGALRLRPAARATGGSPFACVPRSAVPRTSTKALLIEVSHHLERQAARQGSTCLVLSSFQEAANFTPGTRRRYRELAGEVGFVAAIGAGLGVEPVAGVRGADLEPDDPVRQEWDVVVIGPHFAAALLARDLNDQGRDRERTFEFVLTYDRKSVEAAAASLMSRVSARG